MAYVALYRKYRPQIFADVVAQDHIVQTLGNALRQNRLSHAYLLAGPRGTGKTTVARILAKAINCRPRADAGGTEPCNECPSCTAVADGQDLDVLEIDAASNRGIDEIRDLREKVRYAPARSEFKVYIVDEVHMLTNEAFNAFLKTLEDPPAHCVFIFATTDPQKLPATILSRCQRFDFHQVPPQQIIQRLQHVCTMEDIAADERTLVLIARHARGGMRDALAVLDQARAMAATGEITATMLMDVLGATAEATLLALTAAAVGGEVANGLGIIQQLIQSGRDARQVLRDWVEHLRNLLVLRLVGPQASGRLVVVSGDMQKALAAQAAQIPEPILLRTISYLSERDQVIRWAPDGGIVLESAWLHFLELLAAGGPMMNADSAEGPTSGSAAARAAPVAAAMPAPPSRPATPSPPPPPRQETPQPQPPVSTPPAAAETAVSPTPAPPPSADWNLAAVRERWPEFCGQVRTTDSLLAVYLQKGRPTGLSGSRLILSYATDDYAGQRMAKAQEHRQLAAQILQRVWGVKWEIEIVMAPADDATDAAAPATDGMAAIADGAKEVAATTTTSEQAFVQEALRLLAGRLLDSEAPLGLVKDENLPSGGIEP